jgi:hypothetical protein
VDFAVLDVILDNLPIAEIKPVTRARREAKANI